MSASESPAPKHLPRILSKADAAAYCGLTEPGFTTWVKTGKLPRAMKGTRRWDKVALDQALDILSGVSTEPPPPKRSSLADYLAKREARKAADAERYAEIDRKSVNPAAQRRHRTRLDGNKTTKKVSAPKAQRP